MCSELGVEGDSQAMKLRSTRYVKYWCAYHFVWIPKCRDVLVREVAEYTKGVLKEIAGELGCEVLALEVKPDYVHVYLLCPPRLAPSYIANYLKGKSARKVLQKFPELKSKSKKLWTRSYFVATVGNVTSEMVKRYVEEQWRKENDKE